MSSNLVSGLELLRNREGKAWITLREAEAAAVMLRIHSLEVEVEKYKAWAAACDTPNAEHYGDEEARSNERIERDRFNTWRRAAYTCGLQFDEVQMMWCAWQAALQGETPDDRAELLIEIRNSHAALKYAEGASGRGEPDACKCRYCSPPKTSVAPTCEKHGVELAFDGDGCWECSKEER